MNFLDTLSGYLTSGATAYAANQQAQTAEDNRRSQEARAKKLKQALPWVIGGVIAVVVLLFALRRRP